MDLNQILFGVYPYIALSVLAIGSVIRFDREQYTWRSGSSQLLRRRQLVAGSLMFHIGVLAIFAGQDVDLGFSGIDASTGPGAAVHTEPAR